MEKYAKGIPVAGLSAGALIIPEICIIGHGETEKINHEYLQGIGLIDAVIDVHFSETQGLPRIVELTKKLKRKIGYGIDANACAVFEDGIFTRALGGKVHEVRA